VFKKIKEKLSFDLGKKKKKKKKVKMNQKKKKKKKRVNEQP